MGLFGLDRFISPESNGAQPPQKGGCAVFAAVWDNLGGLFGANLLCCAGFLPLALGVSLGLVYENFWLCLLLGAGGGALAGICWTPLFSLCLQALTGGTRGWMHRWQRAAGACLGSAALGGGALGLLAGAGLLVGNLAAASLGQLEASPLIVWVALAVDGFLLALAAALGTAVLCLRLSAQKGRGPKAAGEESPLRRALVLLLASPGRAFAAALVLLAWALGLVALFPVSVPFALVVGFWPPALLAAQLLLDPLDDCFGLPAWNRDAPRPLSSHRTPGGARGYTPAQNAEIFWRRRGPAVLIAVGVIALVAWGGSRLFLQPEPDLQIGVVHAQSLPDGVIAALEDALAQLVGDRNGDGRAVALVNDYTVVFDGSATDMDRQTAGATLLVTDLAAGESTLLLVEDPEGFLERYADRVIPQAAVLWAGCPALAGLDAGRYSLLEAMDTNLSGQELLASLTVLPGADADPELLDILLPPGEGSQQP